MTDDELVERFFPCNCGYDEASATCFDSGHDLGCKSRHSDVGTALAARIRAEAELETKLLRNQRDKYANLARQHGAIVPTADQDEDEIDAAIRKETTR